MDLYRLPQSESGTDCVGLQLSSVQLQSGIRRTSVAGSTMRFEQSISIIEAHGGRVRVSSNAGHGATIRSSLPSITADAS